MHTVLDRLLPPSGTTSTSPRPGAPPTACIFSSSLRLVKEPCRRLNAGPIATLAPPDCLWWWHRRPF